MTLRSLTRLLVFNLLMFGPAWAHAQTDSTTIYKEIHEYSLKHKVTRWIYSGIFVEPKSAQEAPASAPRSERVDPFMKDEGKVVRHIEVHSFDPFGYSVDDTALAPVNGLQRWGNSLHRRTRARIVRDLLLVKPLKPLDALQASESERVLRASPFVNDARIIVQPVKGAKDSVDLLVLVHDKWSIDVSGEADLTSASARIRERNFLGWGQSLQQRVGYSLDEPQLSFSGAHEVYNIRNYHLSSYAHYALSPDEDEFGFSFQRPFYSPLTKWAAGFTWGQTWSKYETLGSEGAVISSYSLSPASMDLWAGRSFPLGDGTEPGSRNSNFVVAARYAQTRYATRPPRSLDPEGVFGNQALFLVSTGLSIRQYYKERFLFRFGSSEDVPEGLLLKFTTGLRKQEREVNTPYLGVYGSRGRRYEGLGYLSIALGYGTYFDRSGPEDGTFLGMLLYFTDLKSSGRWHFRQFVRFNVIYGSQKPSYAYVDFNGSQLYGFSSDLLTGTHKEILRLESVFYAPWDLLGFRVAPVLMIGLGTIGQEVDPVFSGRIQSAFSLGLLVRNENLLVRTFQISVGYFPYWPDTGMSSIVFNNFGSFSAGTWDFDFQEPAEVPFE